MKEALDVVDSIGTEFLRAVRDIGRIPQAWRERRHPPLELPIVVASTAQSPASPEQLSVAEALPPVESAERSVLTIATKWDIGGIRELVTDAEILFEVDDYLRAEDIVGLKDKAFIFSGILIYTHGLVSEEKPIARIIEAAKKQGYRPNKILIVVPEHPQKVIDIDNALLCQRGEVDFITRFLTEGISEEEAKELPKPTMVKKSLRELFQVPETQEASPVPQSRPEQLQVNSTIAQHTDSSALNAHEIRKGAQEISNRPVSTVTGLLRRWTDGIDNEALPSTGATAILEAARLPDVLQPQPYKVLTLNLTRTMGLTLSSNFPGLHDVMTKTISVIDAMNALDKGSFDRLYVKMSEEESMTAIQGLLSSAVKARKSIGGVQRLVSMSVLDRDKFSDKTYIPYLGRQTGVLVYYDSKMQTLVCQHGNINVIFAFLRGDEFYQPTSKELEIAMSRSGK